MCCYKPALLLTCNYKHCRVVTKETSVSVTYMVANVQLCCQHGIDIFLARGVFNTQAVNVPCTGYLATESTDFTSFCSSKISGLRASLCNNSDQA